MTQTGTSGFGSGPTLPATCSSGDLFVTTNPPALSIGIGVDHWATIANVVDESSAHTLNGTPVKIYGFPVAANRAYLITIEFVATRSDFVTGAGGVVRGLFLRDGGDVSRSGAQAKTIVGGMSATVDVVATPATQTADVLISGEGTHSNEWRVRTYAYGI